MTINKVAIFVEGYCELAFVTKLIQEIANDNAVEIEWKRISGGSTTPRRTIQLGITLSPGHSTFVLIVDCGGDDAVKSRMLEEYEPLAKSGYSKIICIRDVYPKYTRNEVPLLERYLPLHVRTKPIVVDFILSVMEIEAWFLAEHTHFERIDPQLNAQMITASLGFDPSAHDMQDRFNPASDLHACYALVGRSYKKGQVQATINAIDFATVYCVLVGKFPGLSKLCGILDKCLSPHVAATA